jgi:hypothetical protein
VEEGERQEYNQEGQVHSGASVDVYSTDHAPSMAFGIWDPRVLAATE